ncbi:hypothetical protein KR084_004557 [Drosophila pseudotakahashii]|nr:hypothetical protein KR084_004557 [Drosophila pseudotakahashii]
MEDLHQQSLAAARHSLILGQKLGVAHYHHHHLNRHLNQLSQLNQLHQLNHLAQLSQLQQHLHHQLNLATGLNLNLGLGHKVQHLNRQMQMLSMRMGLGGLHLNLDLDMGVPMDRDPEGSSSASSTTSSASSTSTSSDQGQGHGNGIGIGMGAQVQGQVPYAHGPAQDNGDSLCVQGSGVKEMEGHTEEEGDSLGKKDRELEPSADILLRAANSKLNADAMAYTMPPKVETLLPPKPSQSARDFRLNAEAAVFKPSLLGLGSLVQPLALLPAISLPLLPAISPPLLPTPHLLGQGALHLGSKQYVRWRKQPLPDLFTAVLSLMRELGRSSVSYPEIINTLAVRLQRPEVELKRHVPHTLHSAVNNGYLKKEGNRYSLVSELEQLEIMRRNQEAAMRAKELEKEPLSWRKR